MSKDKRKSKSVKIDKDPSFFTLKLMTYTEAREKDAERVRKDKLAVLVAKYGDDIPEKLLTDLGY
jgi:hypothetical protein